LGNESRIFFGGPWLIKISVSDGIYAKRVLRSSSLGVNAHVGRGGTYGVPKNL